MLKDENTAFAEEEQQLFRQEVRRFVESEVIPCVDDWEKNEQIPRSFWLRLGELGYLGLDYPESYGGSGTNFVAKKIFFAELSRGGSMGVTLSVGVHSDMSSRYILELGTDEQRGRYLPSLIAGKRICGIAITEPNAGSDVAGIQTRAERQGDSYVLNGTKTFVSNGVFGDVFILAARTHASKAQQRQAGISLFIVERGTQGFSTSRKLGKLGCWSSDTAELSFQDCAIPASNLLGKEGNGFRHLMVNLQRERLIISIVACASANRVLEDVLSYARERQAFGRPIAHFQAIRHRIAELAASLEVATTFVDHLCSLFGRDRATDSQVSIGKLFSTQVANEIADGAVQVFGGYGYMREFPIERFYRDARILKIAGGTSEILKEIIAKRLQLVGSDSEAI